MASSSPRVLFIVLGDELIGIDFMQLKSTRCTHAPICFRENLLRLLQNKKQVIVGMQHITSGSNVYFLGGEKLKDEAIPINRRNASELAESYIGFSPHTFRLVNKNNTFALKHSPTMGLLYGKCSPMVAKIGGKVYVLGGMSYLYDHHIQSWGTFEVYDPNGKYWTILCDPPCYLLGNTNGRISGHFVLGHKLFIVSNSGSYFFDTLTHNGWQALAPQVVESFKQAGLPQPPANGLSVPFFPQLLTNYNLQLVLYRDKIGEAYALLIDSSTGMLRFYQPLTNVFYGRYPVTEWGQRATLSKGRNFFFVLPNNQICAMWAASDQPTRLRLFITIFALGSCINPEEKKVSSSSASPPRKRSFLETSIIHICDYKVTKEIATTSNHVFDAFLY